MANVFDAYFRKADLDGDGQISGAEAVAFLQGSGLPRPVLAQVWTYADQRKAGFLSRQEFYNALKLVTVAQSKRDLTPDIVKAALYGPASAKIPAPQIKFAATPSPNAAAPAPQVAGTAPTTPQAQNIGMPPQVPVNALTNHQHVPSQQNQFMRPPQGMPVNSVPNPQQMLAGQGLPRSSNVTAPRPPNSIVSTDRIMGAVTTQNLSRGVSPPKAHNGVGLMMASGGMSAVQHRPQVTTGFTPSATPKPQDVSAPSNQSGTTDSKGVGNGYVSDSLFGDVFSAAPIQPAQSSSSPAPSSSVSSVSSATVASSVGSQPSVNPQSAAQTFPVTSGSSVAAGNSASNQSQPPWPKMTQSDIQKYMKVFVQVDRDRDGKITGEQARNLFLSWKLPREVLKQVWDLSDQDNDSMLSLKEFCTALYLMERSREGRALPTTLPSSVMSDETLLSATSHLATTHGHGAFGPASVSRQPQVVLGPQQPQVVPRPRPTAFAAPRPPRPPPVHHAEERLPSQQKPKVPVLEKHLVDQFSQDEQDSLNSKFEEAAQADKKVEELEKEIADSRQKIEFYRVKMQELILYKSRCDSRLNEVSERVIADKREAEALAKRYEERYKQTGDVASKLTIEEATFRDIQEKKMELYKAIVKMEEGGTADGVLKERAERIQSGLEELVKNVNERCKQYGLHAKPISLVELPFGWQPGVQEGAADWDEDWDKLEDEGFAFVKELTLDVQNVVAPPKPKLSVKNAISPDQDLGSSPSKAEENSENVSSPREPIHEKELLHDQSENGAEKSPHSSAERNAGKSQSHEFQDSPFKDRSGADGSPHAKEIKSDMSGTDSMHSGDRSGSLPALGTFDSHYDTESNWASDSISGKDLDHDRLGGSSLFDLGDFGLNPIKTGSLHVNNTYQGKSTSLFADSVPSTPAYDQGRSLFADSVPSTPAYNQGRGLFADSVPSTPVYNQGRSLFADSVPSTPAYNQGKSLFADSVPSTPAYNQRNNSSFGFADSVPGTRAYNFGKFNEGSEDHSFDSFSRFDSFNLNDSGSFQSPRYSVGRFDSMRSSRDSDYRLPSRFDSFSESKDFDQNHDLSRFDSFRDSDQSHGFSRFDSFRDSDQSHGFSQFDSFKDSDQSHGFSRFDSFKDSDQSRGFSQFDSFRESVHDQGFSRFDSFRDSDNSHGFPSRFNSLQETDKSHGFSSSFDSFSANDSGFFQSSSNLFGMSDSARGPNDHDKHHAFSSFDETPRSSDNWKAF